MPGEGDSIMRVDQMLEYAEKCITLLSCEVLIVGDTCLARHPCTRRYHKVTIISLIRGSSVQRAIVRNAQGEEWIASRYVLKEVATLIKGEQ